MKIKTIVVTVSMFGVLGLSSGLYLYNKPRKNITGVSPDYILSAQTLAEEYILNEQRANEKYLGKVLLMKGEVLSVESSELVVITFKGSDLSNVRAEMEKGLEVKGNLTGKAIEIKGKCTGLLMDVVLSDCILLYLPK